MGGKELIHLRELLLRAIDPALCGSSQQWKQKRVSLVVPGHRFHCVFSATVQQSVQCFVVFLIRTV